MTNAAEAQNDAVASQICANVRNERDVQDTAQDTMNSFELAAICDQRADTYSLLARLFRSEVDEGLLERLLDANYPVSSGNALMDSGYYRIAKYLSNEWVDPLTKLSIDFSKTFLGSGIDADSAAYPFESVYTSERRLLMQDARDEVLAIYRSRGLDKADSWNVGEDHIAVELEFLHIMSTRCADSLRAENMDDAFSQMNTSYNFLADHISTWVPVFTADMRRFANTMFYQGLADLTEGFLEEDLAFTESMIAGA